MCISRYFTNSICMEMSCSSTLSFPFYLLVVQAAAVAAGWHVCSKHLLILQELLYNIDEQDNIMAGREAGLHEVGGCLQPLVFSPQGNHTRRYLWVGRVNQIKKERTLMLIMLMTLSPSCAKINTTKAACLNIWQLTEDMLLYMARGLARRHTAGKQYTIPP